MAASRHGASDATLAELARFRGRVHFVSVDPARNRARFYTLTWQPALWGGGAVVHAWGRLGSPGRTLTHFYPDRATAQAHVERLIRPRPVAATRPL